MKRKKLKYPYSKYYGYKIFHKKQGRFYVSMVHKVSGKRKTVSLARYKMSVSLGRRLMKDEQVDHIDEDKTNDVISNLQILSRADNIIKHFLTLGKNTVLIKLKCPVCNKTFKRPPRNVNHKIAKGKKLTCS